MNPGFSPIGNLPTVIALAVNLLDVDPDEALLATTRDAAYVLGLDGDYGTITPEFTANAVVLDTNSVVDIPYRLGHNPVHRVILTGHPI